MRILLSFFMFFFLSMHARFSGIQLTDDGSAYEYIKVSARGNRNSLFAVELKDMPQNYKIQLHALYYTDRYLFAKTLGRNMLGSDPKEYQFSRQGKHCKGHYRILCRHNERLVHCSDYVDVKKIANKGNAGTIDTFLLGKK